jgi:hypothetical protein
MPGRPLFHPPAAALWRLRGQVPAGAGVARAAGADQCAQRPGWRRCAAPRRVGLLPAAPGSVGTARAAVHQPGGHAHRRNRGGKGSGRQPVPSRRTCDCSGAARWNEEKARAIDDGAGFSPWNDLQAHRPLGEIMRVRKPAYASSQAFCSRKNGIVLNARRGPVCGSLQGNSGRPHRPLAVRCARPPGPRPGRRRRTWWPGQACRPWLQADGPRSGPGVRRSCPGDGPARSRPRWD